MILSCSQRTMLSMYENIPTVSPPVSKYIMRCLLQSHSISYTLHNVYIQVLIHIIVSSKLHTKTVKYLLCKVTQENSLRYNLCFLLNKLQGSENIASWRELPEWYVHYEVLGHFQPHTLRKRTTLECRILQASGNVLTCSRNTLMCTYN